jgi:hypothetical protein
MDSRYIPFRCPASDYKTLERLKKVLGTPYNSDAIKFCIRLTASFLNTSLNDEKMADIITKAAKRTLREAERREKEKEEVVKNA